MITIKIDNKEIQVKPKTTIIQACALIGIEIPKFCYHEKLSIAGNCRICLVEVKNSPKPVASCAREVEKDMEVYTDTKLVKTAREGVLEFLLANHPLDCPICDQGGECDLQDLTLIYGNDRKRFNEIKTSVTEKELGPLIKTVMTRCIHCTRCVRFGEEIAGTADLGTTGRGSNMEISTYIRSFLSSEISGNIIDLCPVGALTSKPSAFTSRSWELNKTPSIDTFDAIGSNLIIQSRGLDIIRILPRVNEEINQEWISDKVRFSYDGIKNQRILVPLFRNNTNKNFEKISWVEALSLLKKEVSKKDITIGGIVGQSTDLKASVVFRELLLKLKANSIQGTEYPLFINNDFKDNYIYKDKLNSISNNDLCIIIGCNTKTEAPTFNIRIIEAVKKKTLKVIKIGSYSKNSFGDNHIGQTISTLIEISEGRHPVCQHILKSKNPTIILGSYLFKNKNSYKILNTLTDRIRAFCSKISINILHNTANAINSLELNLNKNIDFIASEEIGNSLTYLLNVNSKYTRRSSKEFIVYQGAIASDNAKISNLILPSLTVYEMNTIFINTEGRSQHAYRAIENLLNDKPDWTVLLAITKFLKLKTDINNEDDIINYIKNYLPNSLEFNKVIKSKVSQLDRRDFLPEKTKEFIISNYITDFYKTDLITNNSKVMNNCSNSFFKN